MTRFCKCFGRALIMSGLFAAQVPASPSCYPTFKAETTYKAGTNVSASIVEHTTEPCAPDLTHQTDNSTSLCNSDGTRPVAITRTYNYRCVDGPMSLYCQQGWAFDPASLYGHDVWEKLEECHVSLGDSSPHLTQRSRQLMTHRSDVWIAERDCLVSQHMEPR